MKYGTFVDCDGELAFQLSFLAKAVSNDWEKYFLQEIYVEPSEQEEGALRGVSTDGRRLHLVDPLSKATEMVGIIPGYWRVLKNTKKPIVWAARLDDSETKGWKYPAYRNIIPAGEAEYKTVFTGFSLNGEYRNFGDLAKFLHDFPKVTGINLNYLHDLGTDFGWEVDWYGANKSLKFTNNNRMALIMPMEVE